jgi:hypothetical protein
MITYDLSITKQRLEGSDDPVRYIKDTFLYLDSLLSLDRLGENT